jgi:hypothetical protein
MGQQSALPAWTLITPVFAMLALPGAGMGVSGIYMVVVAGVKQICCRVLYCWLFLPSIYLLPLCLKQQNFYE